MDSITASAREPAVLSLPPDLESDLLVSLLTSSSAGIVYVDPGLTIRAANEALARQVGLPLSRIIGHPAPEIIPGWEEQVAPVCRRVRDSRHPFHISAYPAEPGAQPGRPVRYWEVTVAPVLAREGAFRGWLLEQREAPRPDLVEAERQARQEWIDTVEGMTEAFATLDRDGRVTYVNRQGERLSGMRREEILGRSIWELFPEAVGTVFYEQYRRAKTEHVPVRYEAPYPPLGLSLEVRAYPSPHGLSVFFFDITGRRHAEANAAFLSEIDGDLARLSSPDEIMAVVGDKIKRYYGASRLMIAEAGNEAGTLTGIYDNHNPRFPSAMGTERIEDYANASYVRDLKAGRVIVNNDLTADPRTALSVEAAARWGVRAHLVAPYLRDGRLAFVVAIQLPQAHAWRADEIELFQQLVTRLSIRIERARAVNALRASEEKYRTLFDTIDEGVSFVEIIYDASGKAVDYTILEANPAQQRMTGLRDIVGRRVRELVPHIEASWLEAFGRVAATGEPARLEGRVDGLDRWFDVYAARTAGDRNARLVLVFNDITARKRAEVERERLLQAERRAREGAEEAVHARDLFLETAAHELKTPITNLRGFAQTVVRQLEREEAPDRARTLRAMNTIDRQSDRLARLEQQLLDVADLENGQLRLRRQETDLVPLLQNLVADVQAGARRHPIALQAPPSLPAFVDPLRIEQVMANLLDNAVKFGRPDTPIEIELSSPDPGMVRLSVRDYGPGIPPERRAQLFSRFYRVQDKRPVSGLGLGLYYSRAIVEQHGGTIAAEFPLDGGSRFIVTLPRDLNGAAHGDVAPEGSEGQRDL